MTALSRAAVTVSSRTSEVRELPVPQVTADTGILQVEAAGVCGSDVGLWSADLPPLILGHENVGRIAELGASAARAWGAQVGDRVLIEEYLPCGHCHFCRSGEFRSCMASDTSVNPDAVRFGSTSLERSPGLWGGYSEQLHLPPNSVLHRVPDGVPAHLATLGLPVGNGYQWIVLDGGVRPGDTVVVMGPGQAGLGAVIAAHEAGAGTIIVSGLERDVDRLEVARKLGAHQTVVLAGDDEPLQQAVADATGGRGADIVLDVAQGSDVTLTSALHAVAKRGTILMAAASRRPLSNFPVWTLSRKHADLRAVRGHSFESVEWALAQIARDVERAALLSTWTGGLDQLDEALALTAGLHTDPIVHATILPAETGSSSLGSSPSSSHRTEQS